MSMEDVAPHGHLIEAPPIGSGSMESRLVGTRGWLLVFCLILTVFSPFRALAVALSQPFALSALNLAISAYGAFAGVMLWRERKAAARKHLKIYFGILLVVGTFAVPLLRLFVAWMNATSVSETVSSTVLDALRIFAFVACWTAYLKGSKRVKAIFGENWF